MYFTIMEVVKDSYARPIKDNSGWLKRTI
jgi:hypothetical protein